MRIDWASRATRSPHEGVQVATVDGAGFTVSRYEVAPGGRFPRHRHIDEKVLVVLRGQLSFTVGEVVSDLGSGEVLLVPSNAHDGRAGPRGALFLAIAVPRRDASHAIEYL